MGYHVTFLGKARAVVRGLTLEDLKGMVLRNCYVRGWFIILGFRIQGFGLRV